MYWYGDVTSGSPVEAVGKSISTGEAFWYGYFFVPIFTDSFICDKKENGSTTIGPAFIVGQTGHSFINSLFGLDK